MNAEEILDRIKILTQSSLIHIPEMVYYSGPNHSEKAIYFGDTNKYKDLIDFWIAILCWVSYDMMEFDDISILNSKKEYPSKFYF